MAKETKTDYCSVSQENNFIQTWETFGWEVVTTQKCDYHGYDAVKITFSRDKDMKNYDELLRLDNEFHKDQDLIAILKEEKTSLKKSMSEPPKFNIFIFLFLSSMCLCIPGIVYAVIHFKAKKEYEEEYQKIRKRSKEIDDKIIELVNNCEGYVKQAKSLA